MNYNRRLHEISARRDELGDYLAWRRYIAQTPERKAFYGKLMEDNYDRRIKEYDRLGARYQNWLNETKR